MQLQQLWNEVSELLRSIQHSLEHVCWEVVHWESCKKLRFTRLSNSIFTNGSPNPEQKTKPSIDYQEKMNLSCEFYILADQRERKKKWKEKRKYDPLGVWGWRWCQLQLARCEQYIKAYQNTGGNENQKRNRVHPDYSNDRNPQKTEETCCHSNINEQLSANAGIKKNSKREIIIIIIIISEERKMTSTWEYWKQTPSNKWRWKKKTTKEGLRRTMKLIETKFCSRNFIKRTWAAILIRYSGPFLKLTKKELKKMDQRTRKLITMYKVLHRKDDIDRLYGKVTGKVGNRRTNRDHPNYRNPKIGQNTVKNPIDFRRVAVT